MAALKLKEQILEQIPTPVMAVDKDLRLLYMNKSSLELLGKSEADVIGKQCYDVVHSSHCGTKSCCMLKSLETGETCSDRAELPTRNGMTVVEYYAVPLKDEEGNVIGGLEFAVDITAQAQYEERLREQNQTIRLMSTPTIKLWEGVLVLPVVGVIDSMRAQNMMETMLNRIVETYSKVIILDIQGVAAVDTAVANHLIKITKATKLLGCECILSGISPAVAQTIINLGIDMNAIKTKSTLSDALLEALEIIDLEVTQKQR
ncbi:MAG TPA: PAS domain-containing protein [Eubacteriales bacterium]|mgnify:CR=1 FL=1|nr:PAS domain-containing protein [Eubacteriales bacterium]